MASTLDELDIVTDTKVGFNSIVALQTMFEQLILSHCLKWKGFSTMYDIILQVLSKTANVDLLGAGMYHDCDPVKFSYGKVKICCLHSPIYLLTKTSILSSF